MSNVLHCGKYLLTLDRPYIMGIVNVTPDSFSDGGKFFDTSRAVEHGWQLIDEGAQILDIGGESSRPGAKPVSVDDELRRVIPVIEALAGAGIPLSVDTVKPEVMRASIEAGASIVNDIKALQASGAIEAVADSNVAVCLMHMQGEPRTMQQEPHYENAVDEVYEFLARRVAALKAAGIHSERIIVDPGFGFGKRLEDNVALLRELNRFADLSGAILVGLSRKSMFGQITGRGVGERTTASVAAALIAAQNGANIIRVHNVAATRDALAVLAAVSAPSPAVPPM